MKERISEPFRENDSNYVCMFGSFYYVKRKGEMPMNITLDIENTGRNIKDICREQGVSVDDIACMLGVSAQTIYSWFSGTKMPTVDHLIELADVLDVTVDELLVRRPYG